MTSASPGQPATAVDMQSPSRIAIRLLTIDDRPLYRALYTCAEVMRGIGEPLAVDVADAQFERVVRHNRACLPGHRAWAIESCADRVPLGVVALLRNGRRAEFGIMLLPHAWRQGYATETLRTLLPHAFGEMDLELLEVRRPDDPHAIVVHRMLAPFSFRRLVQPETGWVRWIRPADIRAAHSCPGVG